jgi:hypothetical protein
MSAQAPLQSVCHDWQTQIPPWQYLPLLHNSPEAPHPQMPGCTHLSPGLQPDVGWSGCSQSGSQAPQLQLQPSPAP